MKPAAIENTIVTRLPELCRKLMPLLEPKAETPQRAAAIAYTGAILSGAVEQAAAQYRQPIEEAYRVQALYIVGNLQYLRGPEIAEIRKELHELSKRN